MRNQRQLISYIIFGLIIIGIISSFVKNPAPMLVPLVVFGVIFLLYKYPPAQLRRLFKNNKNRSTQSSSRPSSKNGSARKNTTFRVIKGNKRDDDEPPRYH